jgi:selenocysteine lyase/cysteine desulfurase
MAEAAAFSAAELARLRADTPGTANVLHFNSAGSALPPAPVLDAMLAHLRLEADIGGYEAFERERTAVERPYAALAALLNCGTDEIALTDCATRAWDMAFYAVPLRPGDRVLTGASEYCSNFIAFLHRARRDGIEIDVAPSTPEGEICVEGLAAMIGPRTRLIAVTHVPSSGGLVNPAAAVGRVARAAGVPYLLDACQSVGQMPIDVEALGCDMLSATARKFLRGPRGVGFLYVRRALLDALDPPMLDDHAADWCADDAYALRGDARRFETFECNFAGRAGFGVALDYAMGWGILRIAARVAALAALLRGALAEIPGVAQHDLGRERCGIVTFSVAGTGADAVKAALRAQGINVTVSTAAATRLDMVPRGLDRIIRASVHVYNDEEDIARFAAAVARLARAAAS